MKKIKLLFISLLACLSLWAQNDKQIIMKTTVSLRSMLGEDYKRVELSAKDIRMADSLVNLYIVANYRHYDWTRKIDTYYEYYRQYAGYKESPSKIIIFINAYRRKASGEHYTPEEQFVSYKGGGSDYFQVKIDPQSKKCFDLNVNAPK